MPMTQLISRGLRKAPVKKTRIMCKPTAATKNSADQWWIWRMQQAAADVEGDVERGGVCLRHPDPLSGT